MTREELLATFSYDPNTGEFTRRRDGKVIVPMISQGYKRLWFKGHLYQQHRVAWLYVYGRWPAFRIDHINMDRLDNRIANLRECDMSQNLMNARAHRDNACGFKGVSRNHKRWQANISAYGQHTYLGTFDTPEEAHAAYAAAAERIHGQFARAA